MESKLGKVAKEETDREIIQLIIADINRYIRNEDQEYLTTQHIIGMQLIFKGWVVRN